MLEPVDAPVVEPSEEERAAALVEEQRAAEEAAKVPAAARAELRGVPESRVSPHSEFELREVPDGTGGTNLRFTGFASTTGDDATYEMEDWLGPWTESIALSAFDNTLNRGADVAFLLNHTGMTLARTKPGTLKLSAVKDAYTSPVAGVTGLYSEALLDPQNLYVQAMRSAVERGDLDECSFAFRVVRQEWDKDYTRRWINEVNLDKGDVSLVNYGANPHTGGTVAMRQLIRTRDAEPVDFRRLMFRLFEQRMGDSLDPAALQSVLDKADNADTNLDELLMELSDLMGVVNPDIAQDAALERDDEEGETEALSLPTLFVPDFRADRARLESLRHAPRSA